MLIVGCERQPTTDIPSLPEKTTQATEPQKVTLTAEEAQYLDTLYGTNSNVLYWQDDRNYAALIAGIAGLEAHGLNPLDYHIEDLKARVDNKTQRDPLATHAWLSAADHLSNGKVNPVSVEPDWSLARDINNLPEKLKKALGKNSISQSFDELTQPSAQYETLKLELAKLRLQTEDPIKTIPEGPALSYGIRTERVMALQKRLLQLGLIKLRNQSGEFDESTQNAIKLFQTRNDIEADGIVGPTTIRALNRSLEDKINQIRVNMERARWLPDNMGDRHIRVNIAAFEATAWKNGTIERRHPVIIGKPFRNTPVFSDEIEYLIFNPWWETPPTLARRDKLPTFQKDPASIKRLGFQVLNRAGDVVDPDLIDWNLIDAASFPYQLRQAPGPLNALGQVKIIFPNRHNAYMHDTPSKALFDRQYRAFSSGCIRTYDPLALSEWILSETEGWSRQYIDLAVTSGQETRVPLTHRVPIHILYNTVTIGPDNSLHYLDDIYERDPTVLKALDAPLPL